MAEPEKIEEVQDVEAARVQSNTDHFIDEASYPDGGTRAWLIVAGATCSNIVAFGYATSFGVFQSYYEQNTLKDSSPSTIAWIGSIQSFLLFFPGLFTGRLFDLGYFRLPLFLSSALLVLSTFLVAQCTKYWQFLLCQGIASGLASGTIFSPVMSVIGHWFLKKRGLALGIVMVGSSIGGTTLPITVRKLIDIVGFPWTMRILGFIFLAILALPNLVLRRRLPPKQVSGGLWNFKTFRDSPAYTTFCVAGFLQQLGLYTVSTFIDISAVSAGISPQFTFYLISILNGTATFGRLLGGQFADIFGGGNVLIPSQIGISLIAFTWPLSQSKGAFIAVAVVYGFTAGAFSTVFTMPVYLMGDMYDFGRRLGMLMSIMSIASLAGTPISGALNRITNGYSAPGYWAGLTMLAAAVVTTISRYLVIGKSTGKF